MFNRPVAVIEARLMNTVEDVGKWRAVSGLITQTKGIFSAAKSIATAFVWSPSSLPQLSANDGKVPCSVRGQSPHLSASHLTHSDAFFVDLEAGIVESYEDQGQPFQDCHATSSRATVPCATAPSTASPRDQTLNTKVYQKGVHNNKPPAHLSKLTNLEGIVGHGVGVAPCNPAVMPTTSSQLPEKTPESNRATEDCVQYPPCQCHVDTKPIALEISPISVHSLKISSIPMTTQEKPAFKNYKPPTVEDVLPEGRGQTPSHSHSHAETHAPSRPNKQTQAKRSKRAKKVPKVRDVKTQGLEENRKHTTSNLPEFIAKPLKRNATLSESGEYLEGQNHEQKAKKAKKAHESRFDLDEAMMDAPASLPEMATNSTNPSPKRKSQFLEAEQAAQKQSKRAKNCPQTKGVEGDVMMDVDPAESHIPSVAPPTTGGASLKRGLATPKANEAAAKKPKQKHEGKLPIDVCIEFEDITQLVDARLREKEDKREEERKRREAPKILKRSRGETAAAEAGKSAKKAKTAEKAEEAEKPELPKALKRGRGSDDEAEKPKKKTKLN